MGFFSFKAIGAAISVYLLAQQCQCPQVAIPAIIESVAGVTAAVGSFGISVGSAVVQEEYAKREEVDLVENEGERFFSPRDFTAPAGVPQYNFDLCYNSLADPNVVLTINGPVANHGVQVDGLPADCMDLATVIDGSAVGGPVPIPCGSACLLYDNLNPGQYAMMMKTFLQLKNR